MKLVPKRRFAGFWGEWKEQKLKEIADIVGGGTPSTSNPDYWNGNIDWYSPSEIGKKVFADGSVKTITQLGLEKSSANLLPPNRTILFTSRASIGDMAILCRPGATNQGFQSLVLRDGIDTYFMYSMGHLIKEEALKNASGSTFLEISGQNLGKIEILIPSQDEQQKIGSFFKKLDERIAMQEAKVEKLKAMKQAYLHEMFPAEGESVPKRRFAGFVGDWKKQRLGDVVQITMGQSPSSKNYTNDPSNHILVQGNLDMRNNRVYPRIWTTEVTSLAKKGDLILTVRAPVGDVGKTDYDVVLGRGVAGIKGNEFIFQLLVRLKLNNYWINLSTGSTFDSISSDDIRDATVLVPSPEEQYRIGDFLQKLDQKIAMQEAKVEKLKAMKSAYLNEMFV